MSKLNTVEEKLFYLYYYISSLSIFSLLSIFRSLRVKLFLFMLSIVICTLIVSKRKKDLFQNSNKSEVTLSLFITAFCFLDFYYNASHIRPPRMLSFLHQLSFTSLLAETVFLTLIGIIACIIGFLFVTSIASYLIKVLKELKSVLEKYVSQFLFLLLVYGISFLSIIRANFYYIDDLGRTVYGYELTGDFSRYIANILSEIVHGNSWLADISPLPQLLALVIMAFAGVILLHIISEVCHQIPSKWSFIAIIPFGLSPYFITCLSYKYDAPYMALSVFVSVVPLLFYKRRAVTYCSVVFIGMLLMCMTYQVSSGIFPMIVMMLALFMWVQKEKNNRIVLFILESAFSYILALITYRLVIMNPISEQSYVDVGVSIFNLPSNAIHYCSLLNSDLPFFWKVTMFAIFVCFIVYIGNSTENGRVVYCFAATIICICAFLISFGVYLVFNHPIFSPRAYYGVGVFISVIGCLFFFTDKSKVGKISITCLSWFFLVYTFLYGNALNVQKEYIDFRTEQVINACNDLEMLKTNDKTKIQIIGNSGYHRAVKNIIKEYPILERQIPVLLSDSAAWTWGAYQLREYYGLNIELVDIKPELDTADLIKDTYYFSIYNIDGTIVINIKDVESIIDKATSGDNGM